MNCILLAVEQAVVGTHDRFATEYGCLVEDWVAFAGEFEKTRKRRRLAMESSASQSGWLARSLVMQELDDTSGFMWKQLDRSINKLKVCDPLCVRTVSYHPHWQEMHCTAVYEELKASGHMPLVENSVAVMSPEFVSPEKPMRSVSMYSDSEPRNAPAKASYSEDDLLNDLD